MAKLLSPKITRAYFINIRRRRGNSFTLRKLAAHVKATMLGFKERGARSDYFPRHMRRAISHSSAPTTSRYTALLRSEGMTKPAL